MGVAIRGSFSRIQGHNDELVNWISKVRIKKNGIKKRKRKNLMVEAVLTSALLKAETELKVKQHQRYQRWQRLKSELGLCKMDCTTVGSVATSELVRHWDEKIFEDINSIDTFMSRLSEVKNPLRR